MSTFIAAFLVFACAMTGMAIGLILSKKSLKRGCGQAHAIMRNKGNGSCGNCGKKDLKVQESVD